MSRYDTDGERIFFPRRYRRTPRSRIRKFRRRGTSNTDPSAAEGDEELLVKFIDEAGLSDDDIVKGLSLAIADNRIVPAFAGCALTGAGVHAVLDFIPAIVPSPLGALELALSKDASEVSVKIDPAAPLTAFVIKTSNDQFSGKLSFIKVIGGTLVADSEIYNVTENKKEKIGKLYLLAYNCRPTRNVERS